jgi:prephenate dehydratase
MATREKIAYLGPKHSFSYEVAEIYFKRRDVALHPKKSIKDVIDAVSNKSATVGVAPFWNPYETHIRDTQKLLIKNTTPLIVTGHLRHDIHLCLMAKKSVKFSDIRYIYSNKHVFHQCDRYLNGHLKHVKYRLAESTSEAAKIIKDKKNSAAIGPFNAAIYNNLKILKRNIENPDNFTLFFIIEGCDNIDNAILKLTGQYVLLGLKLPSIDKMKAVTELHKKHLLDNPQKWGWQRKSGRTSDIVAFMEIEGRPIDLNFQNFFRDLKHVSKIPAKCIGFYPETINKNFDSITSF